MCWLEGGEIQWGAFPRKVERCQSKNQLQETSGSSLMHGVEKDSKAH